VSVSGREDVAEALGLIEVLARALHVKDARLQPTLDAIVSAAAGALSPAGEAGLILLAGGKLVPQATAGRAPQVLDLLQQETGDGPCIQAARQQAVIRIADTRADPRWPDFSAQALRLGARSVLCMPLWVHERCLGALTLYAGLPSAFSGHDEQIVTLFATLAALALSEAQRAEQLRTSVASRDLIGQAKGILMERYQITADEAFGRLAQASQSGNMKLQAVAKCLTEIRELPAGQHPDTNEPPPNPNTLP
jgi:GAF domain-containing protein